MTYKVLDVVKTRVDLPGDGIAAGTVGTVVDLYTDGEMEVEFANDRGETLALVAMAPGQLQLVQPLRRAGKSSAQVFGEATALKVSAVNYRKAAA